LTNAPTGYMYTEPDRRVLGPRYDVTFTFAAEGLTSTTVRAELYPYGPGFVAGQKSSAWFYVPPGQQVLDLPVTGGWWPGLSGMMDVLTSRGLPATSPVPIPALNVAHAAAAHSAATQTVNDSLARNWILWAGVVGLVLLVVAGAVAGRPRRTHPLGTPAAKLRIWGTPLRGALDELDLARLVLVDGAGARRAVPAGLHRSPAFGVSRKLGMRRTAGTPLGQQAKRARQLEAVRRQLVGEPGWPPRIGPGHQDALALESLQPVGEDVRGDPGELALEVVEPAGAGQQRFHDQERPPVAHAGQRLLQRGGDAPGSLSGAPRLSRSGATPGHPRVLDRHGRIVGHPRNPPGELALSLQAL
jgi:hypothetical protein